MAKDEAKNARQTEQQGSDGEETRSLLSEHSSEGDTVIDGPGVDSAPSLGRRQSSFARPRPNGTPRTPNRVRFDVDAASLNSQQQNGNAEQMWIEDEDFLSDGAGGSRRTTSESQRLPLLTNIEAPSITVASADIGFNSEDLLENARPKSGMANAFMNMANSIM